MAAVISENRKQGKPAWVSIVAKYQTPSVSASTWQIINSFGPYIALWAIMAVMLNNNVNYLFVLPLTVLAGFFAVRIFIIQHDSGHTSFFKSRRINDLVGTACSVVSMTPYEMWRTGHAKHHAGSGDLDHRGFGDVWTLTVKEYLAASPMTRLGYRLYRHPLVMFGFGPAYMFLLSQRALPSWGRCDTERTRRNLLLTDILIGLMILFWVLTIGGLNYLKIQLPVTIVAGTVGVFLFYVQHQFEDAYWRYHPEWDYAAAALEGSSYLKLPRVLQWITGNIGLHHIHHLSPRIPNYLLEKCMKENEMFQNAPTLTLKTAFKIVFSKLALFDENQDRLLSIEEARETYKAQLQDKAAPMPVVAQRDMPLGQQPEAEPVAGK